MKKSLSLRLYNSKLNIMKRHFIWAAALTVAISMGSCGKKGEIYKDPNANIEERRRIRSWLFSQIICWSNAQPTVW